MMFTMYVPTGRTVGYSTDNMTIGHHTHQETALEDARRAVKLYGGTWRVDVWKWRRSDIINIHKPDIVEVGDPIR